MRKTFLSLLVIMTSVCVQADLYEDFNSLTTGSWSAATEVSLPSGTWTFGSGAQYNKSNNVISIKLNANGAYMITPPTDSIQTLSFAYRSGGSNKKVVISYATASDTWEVLDTLKIASSSSNFSTYSKSVPCDSLQGVRIRLTGLTSNVYIDDVRLSQPKADEGGGGGGGVVIPGEPDPDFTRPIFTATRNTYYISPEGNDLTGDGSFEKPWFNPAKAVAVAQAGDVIFARGGRYLISMRGTDNKLTIRLTQSGTAEEPIVISAYENEVPVFDFEQQLLDCNRNKANVGDRGMLITGNYWILFGLHMMHAADNAIKLEGSHNRIERCEFSYNLDTGIQLGFGHDFSASGLGSKNDGSFCAYNDIIDCDSHHNCDFDMNYGSDADGFACKMHNGIGNRFIRCRAWRNSDDAWDLYETDFAVLLYECWAWESGNAEDHQWPKQYLDGSASFSGNGNGIKLGGNGTGGSSKGIHYAVRCVAFGCDKTSSVKGFDCNSHKDGHVLINCLAFDNAYDYMFESGGSDANTYFYNNICLGKQEISVGSDDYNAITSPMSKLGWSNHLLTGISKDDFQSLSETDALAPRRGDGSMPTRFARLMPNSDLVDAGFAPPASLLAPIEQLYQDYPNLQPKQYGNSWDMGPYELPQEEGTTGIAQAITTPSEGASLEIRLGGEREAIAMFSVPGDCKGQLIVMDISGQILQRIGLGHIISGMTYYQPLKVAQGMHIVVLQTDDCMLQNKFIMP